MTLADWLKFLPGWLAFLWAVGQVVWKAWWVRRHHLALGPEADQLRKQLTDFRALLEEVTSGRHRSDWFMHADRREVGRALRDAAERRDDPSLTAILTRLAEAWNEIFALAPPPRMRVRFLGGSEEVRERRETALRDASDIDQIHKMTGLADEALLDVQKALSRLNELERKTHGRS